MHGSFFRAILNLHMAYASTDEMTTAIEDCVKFGLTHKIDPDTYVYILLSA
jgi:ditrans,polycis-polyprenyl diphosphate synthase